MQTRPETDTAIRQLEDTVDYTKVYAQIREIMELSAIPTAGSLCQYIGGQLLENFPLIWQLTLRIQKPSVPIKESCAAWKLN